MSAEELWDQVHACFDTDDGSLPSVLLADLTDAEVALLFGRIRACSQLVSSEPSFWDPAALCSRPLDSVPNAAALLGEGKAESFHLVLRPSVEEVTVGEVAVPDIGVWVSRGCIGLDYRMGSEWGPPEVWAFFSLLNDLLKSTERGRLELDTEGPPEPDRFIAAWQRMSASSLSTLKLAP